MLVLLCSAAAARAETPVAQLPLPCDSDAEMLSPNGAAVAALCADGTLQLLAVPSGERLQSFPKEPRRTAIAFSDDGVRFAVGYWSGKVRVVPTSGEGGSREWQASDRRIETVHFLADGGELLVVPVGRDTQVWRLASEPQLVASLPSGFAEATALALSADSKLLVAATGDTEVRFYDTQGWKQVRSFRGLLLESFAAAFTHDQAQLLVGGADKQITLIDTATGTLVRALPRQADVVVQLLPLDDGDSVVAKYVDPDDKRPPHWMLWSLRTGTAQPLVPSKQPTAAGLVNGELWLASSAQGRTLVIWKQ
ncbi:MAG: WD40 repeat domain-containing protein [Myxococcaceae bacterium]